MNSIDTIHEPNGYTIEIWQDEDPGNPREDNPETEFPFLGFPHRRYKIGDETWDPEELRIECADCHGTGQLESEEANITVECQRCVGWGYLTCGDGGIGLDEVIEAKAKEVGAVLWRKVGMIDHSGVSYYLGGGRAIGDPQGWDSGTCGVMFVTRDAIKARWGSLPGNYPVAPEDDGWDKSPNNEAFLVECLKGDLQVYDDWASGNCYGFTVTDVNGDEVETCGGFLGGYLTSGILDEARACIPAEPAEKLYVIRLTALEIGSAIAWLSSFGAHVNASTIAKLQEAI